MVAKDRKGMRPSRFCSRCHAVHIGDCPCKPKHNWDVNKKRSGRGGRPWERKRKAVFERDNYLCQIHIKNGIYKAVALHGADAGICDHIIPLEEGGTDDMENLQTICKNCSERKTQQEAARGRGVSKINI